MKKSFLSLFCCIGFAGSVFAQSPLPVKVRVLKDNTNLRAGPALNVEVAGQAAARQELAVKSMDAEWVEVIAPTNIDFWVLGDYLKNNVVVCRRSVNVRAGPGINFSVVGQLTNNASVERRGAHADWVKIAPSECCSLWVARSLVALVPPPVAPARETRVKPPAERPPEKITPAPKTAPIAARETAIRETPPPAEKPGPPLAAESGKEQTGEEKTSALAKPPLDLDLLPDVTQGQLREFEGVLRPKNFLVRSPSHFRLVGYDGGRSHTICFIKGNRAQLEALLFRKLIVSGRQYWVKHQRYPVLVPEKIILK